MHNRALQLIDELGLAQHPEGGYYKEIYRSEIEVLSDKLKDKRPAITDIYFLLVKGQNSKFHSVVHDEIWHFYEGDPLKLHITDPHGNNYRSSLIGGISNQLEGYKTIIKGDNWQAAQTMGDYSLVGCTVGAGFDFNDFKMLDKNSDIADNIVKSHPDIEKFIL